ncbi:type II toxin-antitoxin system YoeB family toxin [Oribacterium sinus]
MRWINGYPCIGKPEPLKGDFSGYWSVRIDEKIELYFASRKRI